MFHHETQLKINSEFITQHKALFESKLANYFFTHAYLFNSVEKVSHAICDFIIQYQAIVAKELKTPKIIEELSDKKYFCRFKKFYDSPQNCVEITTSEFQDLLCLEKNNLCQVMQSQAVFIHRILPSIIAAMDPIQAQSLDEKKKQLVKLIFPNHLFQDRARFQNSEKTALTDVLGITKNPVFSKQAARVDHIHQRALDQFTIDRNSSFFQKIADLNLPTVAGPSGHTGSLLLGAALYGNLTQLELWEYAIACFTFLTAGGHHSFHEVMVVAKEIGIEYEPGHYFKNIPAHLHEHVQPIFNEFPQYIYDNVDQYETHDMRI